jgi:hypothetical protein
MLWLFTDIENVFVTFLDHLLTVSLYPYSTLCLFSFSPNFEKYFVNPLNDMLMRNSLICLLFFLSFLGKAQSTYQYSIAQDSAYIRNNYVKYEFMVKMRDGVQLFTQVYAPKDKSKQHPIIMQRTPYSCNPYGTDKFKKRIDPTLL